MYYKKITALCNYFQGCWLKLCNKFHQMQQINRIHTRSFMFVHLFCIWIQVKPSHHIPPPLLKTTTCKKQKYYYYSYYIYNVWSDFKIRSYKGRIDWQSSWLAHRRKLFESQCVLHTAVRRWQYLIYHTIFFFRSSTYFHKSWTLKAETQVYPKSYSRMR